MIQIDILLQVSGSDVATVDFTPLPFPIYDNGAWYSNLSIGAGLYDETTNKPLLTHESTDNGVTYAIIQNNATYNNTTSVSGIIHSFLDVKAGNDDFATTSGVWIPRRINNGEWETSSFSSVTGSSFGGGNLLIVTYDYTNNEFIFVKDGGSFGNDIFTTPDFVVIANASSGTQNPVTKLANNLLSNMFALYKLGSLYVAYGVPVSDSNVQRAATSTDMLNWTLQGTNLPKSIDLGGSGISTMAFYLGSSRYFQHFYDNNVNQTTRVLHIWYSSNGYSAWTEAPLPPQLEELGLEGFKWFVTAGAIELLTLTHVFRSVNGTTWTRSLLQNNIRHGSSFNGIVYANAKGTVIAPTVGPDHIALSVGTTIQNDGKILALTEVNDPSPTLKYPSSAPSTIVGWLHNNLTAINMVTNDTTILQELANSQILTGQTLYARNSTTTRYCEIEVTSTSNSVTMSGKCLGSDYVTGVGLSATDAVWFTLTTNLIQVSNGNNIVVTHLYGAGQIIGFLYDWVAKTCVIEVDGVFLATVPNINNRLPWIMEATVRSSQLTINVGQTAFAYNGTGATAWMTQGTAVSVPNLLTSTSYFDQSPWTVSGTPVVVSTNNSDIVALPRAYALSDDDVVISEYYTQSVSGLDTASDYNCSIFVLKDAVARTTRFPQLSLVFTGAATETNDITMDTQDGTFSVSGTDPGVAGNVSSYNASWWRVDIKAQSQNAGNTLSHIRVYPAVGANASLAILDPTVTGTTTFFGSQMTKGTALLPYVGIGI
jgi:hypothetical protein